MVAQPWGPVMTYWKCNSLQLFSAQSMQMSYGIALFYIIQHVLFVPCLLQCIYVYVCISVSLSLTFSSLWKFLWVYFSVLFSFNFSFDLSFLFEPLNFPYLFPISWICPSTPSSLSTWKNIHCLIYSFISDKQCEHSQLSNILHFKLLPCKRA